MPLSPLLLPTLGRARVGLRPGLMQWFAQFHDFASHYEVGLVCTRCGQPLGGTNGDHDATLTVECACRTFVAANPDWQAPS